MSPLSLAYLAALTPSNWEIKLIDEYWDEFSFEPADMVGITSFTPTINRAYEIAKIYRDQKVPVVLGGIHASMVPEEAALYADCLVTGEAEPIWSKVISDFEQGKLQKHYEGSPADMSALPFPRRDLLSPKYKVATVLTSRGCPMNCDFCSVTTFNKQDFRQRSPEAVLEELKTITQKVIIFCDDNIVGYGAKARENALQLFWSMKQNKLNKWWASQVSLQVAEDDELLCAMAESGCKGLYFGIESTNEEVLKQMRKGVNLKSGVKNYHKLFANVHSYGIAVVGAMIYGSDADDKRSFRNTADFILKSGLDVAVVSALTPLPGTPFYKRMQEENRLNYTNYPLHWQFYDNKHNLLSSPSFSEKELRLGGMLIRKRIYSIWAIFRRFIRSFWALKNPALAVICAAANLGYRQDLKKKLPGFRMRLRHSAVLNS
jgi:radical SAM superfamily enzyme YgiQ (UPF0313 family)